MNKQNATSTNNLSSNANKPIEENLTSIPSNARQQSTSPSSTSTTQSSIIITELSNDLKTKESFDADNLQLQPVNTNVNKRSSRSHPTPPPMVANPNAQGHHLQQNNVLMGLTPKESPSSSPNPDEQPKRKGRKPLNQSSSPAPDSKQDIKL